MDWAEMNPDHLLLIAKKLGDISNFVRFRVVCKNWRLVVGPQIPWFIEYQPSETEDPSDHKFFSLYSGRTHTLHIPQAKGKDICGPSSWYFLMCDYLNCSGSLFNPLTRFHFSIDDFLNAYPIYIGPDHNANLNPNESDNIEVILLKLKREKDGFHPVVYWRFANRQWTNFF